MARRCTDKEMLKISLSLQDEVEMILFKWPSIEGTVSEDQYRKKLEDLDIISKYFRLSLALAEAWKILSKKSSNILKW
jgi:hypothetical protein